MVKTSFTKFHRDRTSTIDAERSGRQIEVFFAPNNWKNPGYRVGLARIESTRVRRNHRHINAFDFEWSVGDKKAIFKVGAVCSQMNLIAIVWKLQRSVERCATAIRTTKIRKSGFPESILTIDETDSQQPELKEPNRKKAKVQLLQSTSITFRREE